ncbi:MAG: hypothetical protein AAGB46_14385 [Verrucomicrobiota bacterium]
MEFEFLVVLKELVLICDEIGSGYRNRVRGYLQGRVNVWFPEDPIGNTVQLLDVLQDSVLRRQPDIVHISASLGDTKRICYGSDERLVPLEFYEENVRRIVDLIAERSTSKLIWGSIPPVDEKNFNRENDEDGNCDLYDYQSIMEYNDRARSLLSSEGILINDLYGAVKAASREDSFRPNGVHFCEIGCELLARKIVSSVEDCL